MSQKSLRQHVKDPSWLEWQVELEGGFDYTYAVIEFMAGLVAKSGLRPWGRTGKACVRAGMQLLHDDGVLDQWTPCERCGASIDVDFCEDVLEKGIRYYRNTIDVNELFYCAACLARVRTKA